MSFEDVKDLSVAAVLGKMWALADTNEARSELQRLLSFVKGTGWAEQKVGSLGLERGDGAKATKSVKSK